MFFTQYKDFSIFIKNIDFALLLEIVRIFFLVFLYLSYLQCSFQIKLF